MMVLATATETSGHFISLLLHVPNLWLFNLYLLVSTGLEILLASYFLRPVIANKIWVVFAGYAILWCIVIWKNSIFNFAVTCLLVTALLCTLLFVVILIDRAMSSEKGVGADPLFWLCVATIIFYACDIPAISTFTVMADEFIHSHRYLGKLDINDMLNVVSPLLYGVSLLLCGRQNKLKQTYA
jgi:hypothetical protein